ncbi:hypothetical protein [Pantoea sp. FN0305]|uniref:hypothetical protein n=1 Tax=Pantoea sp. FN0305 TaxID=3418559 RepID=UPI003CE9294F
MISLKISKLVGFTLTFCITIDSAMLHAQEFIGYVENTVNPEDMVVIPDTPWVVTSTDRTPGKSKPGYLYLINSVTGVAQLANAKVALVSSAGDPTCKPLELNDLAMSGLAIRSATDGALQLMAVNRGKRMSIEFFNVDLSTSKPALTWSGCLIMPEKAFPNAVTPLSNDSLAVTISFETDNKKFMQQLEDKVNTGYLLEWTKQKGFKRIADSELPLNNGLKISADGKFYYIAGWGSESILRLPTSSGSGKALQVNIGMKPDNLSWSSDGNLIVAGQLQSATSIFNCVASDKDVCPVPFKIIEVDPDTLAILRVLVDGEKMENYAAATTGLEVGKELWVSAFRNTKIARYRLDN